MHLQKPVHADVLLRIDSTNSESSRSSLKIEKPENKPQIEKTANAEIIAASQPTKSEESDGKSYKKSGIFLYFLEVQEFSFAKYFTNPESKGDIF